ncbi:hypothetical protein ZWY2020_056289 [Hordeum vulgare]|nr:hypothetical protein ZWY2020_056289 [Hordeum vulgare]
MGLAELRRPARREVDGGAGAGVWEHGWPAAGQHGGGARRRSWAGDGPGRSWSDCSGPAAQHGLLLLRPVEATRAEACSEMAFHGLIAFQDPLSVGYAPLLETVDLTNVCLSSRKMVKLSEFLGGTSVRNLRFGCNQNI